MKTVKRNIPTILVVFGATGNLMAKKIIPALFHLFKKEMLPDKFRVVGIARRLLSSGQFQKRVVEIISGHLRNRSKSKSLDKFLKLFSYERGFFEGRKDYQALANILGEIDGDLGVCTNKLFYLAVPPNLYETIFKNLATSGLTKPCGPKEGWTRVLVEKPFGKDFGTARRLDELLGKLFKEVQIYRIDHYLAKEMLQNILTFRFSNNLFEIGWGNQLIEKIEIRLLEKIGVEDRGGFYDGVGALRDVGQNHLLQMLALVTMDHPINFGSDAVRSKRAEILEKLEILSLGDAQKLTFRAQYLGYQSIKGVAPNSQTETYFKTIAFLNSPRWQGVSIVMESGKRLGEPQKSITLLLKHPLPCLCPPGSGHYQNKITVSLEPKEGIDIQFWSKKPGLTLDIEKRIFKFLLREKSVRAQYTEEYERLILDCVAGDQTLFVSTEEVKAMWRFVDPIAKAWQKNLVPLRTYKPDTKKVFEESKYIDELDRAPRQIKKEVGIVGLGKMGSNIARHLVEKGWRVVGFNRSPDVTKKLSQEGVVAAYSFKELREKLSRPCLVWLMLPASAKATAGKPSTSPTDEVLTGKNGLVQFLETGDTIIDGGNSFYKDSIRRSRELERRKINFLDVGVSGGPAGARYGATLMVGGKKDLYGKLEPLFRDLSVKDGYGYMGANGAGHFVKMIHNGIEYGVMQAIAEGFAVLKKSKYKLNLKEISAVYNHGSVIESRLVGWLKKGLELHGEDLKGVSGSVGHTGEGEWTVKTAKEEGVKAKIIEEALKFRIESEKNPSYTGKILSALREQFGGHAVGEKK